MSAKIPFPRWLLPWSFLLFLSTVQAGVPIQSWQTSRGTPVLFVATHDLPILDVRVVFRGGSAREGSKAGLAVLTANLLTQGAGPWDADALAERLESLGAELDTGALRDMAYASLRTLSQPQTRASAVEILMQVLANPQFREEDFRRVQRNTLIRLRRDEQDPGVLGRKALYRLIYGDHPYGSHPEGTLESVAALTREDVIAFHRRFYCAENAVLALVGDLNRGEAEQLAEQLTAALPPGEAAPPLPPVPDLPEAVQERIPFPATQTHIYLGQSGMKRGDPDYFPLYVGNHILGGSGLVSLLMEEIREKRGLSYSVSSRFIPMEARGPFILGLSTKNDQAEQAQALLLETLKRFRSQGPTEKELEAAVKNLTGGFPLRIASNRKIVQYLAMMAFYHLPLDYLDTFSDRVAAVTPEAIREAFQRRIHPQRLATVIVGPAPKNP